MVVTFIGIVVPMVRTRPLLVSVIVAGGAALIFYDLPNQLGLIAAALLGIAAGYIAETRLATQPANSTPAQEQSS
jgi:predicted branched-subunit amino acid permease